MRIETRLLGPVDVVVDGAPQAVHGLRRKAILAVLALSRGEVVSVDHLIEAVWNGAAPPTVDNTLQRNVSYLRKALGGRETIQARPPGYVLLLDLPTDAETAADLARRAAASTDDSRRAGWLREALALWRGPSLVDVAELPWLERQARHLEDLRLQVRLALVESRLALGEHPRLVSELEQLATEHPFAEQIHRQLMLALYRTGRQAEALAAYRGLRVNLRDELGIDPGQESRDLEAAMLRQDPALTAAPPAVSPAAPAEVPAQIPAAVYAFAGRSAELSALDSLLARPTPDGGCGTVVISAVSGSAGAGKTSLAVQWAHRVAHRFPDGQLYVNLRGFDPGGSAMDPSAAVRGFLDALDVHPARVPQGLDELTALFRSLVAARRMLILLDNARDAAQVRPLLPGARGCMVVVTSRDRLTPLVAAVGAVPLVLSLLDAEQARDLLARRLGEARTAAEPAAVDEVISHCGGLPLALAIAAARASTNPGSGLAALAAKLRGGASRLDSLRAGDLTTDVRQVFSWSYRLLSPGAARLFRLAGLHPGPDIGESGAASLTGLPRAEVQDLLRELCGASLLNEPVAGRYVLHDLLRVYAAETARAEETETDSRAALRRALAHYLHTAQAAMRLLHGPWCDLPLPPPGPGVTPERPTEPDGANAWFDAELPVLLAAIEQAARDGFETHAWQLAWTLTLLLDGRGLWREYRATQECALAAALRTGDENGQAHAHHGLGRAYSLAGLADDGRRHLSAALGLYGAVDDLVGQGNVHLGIGFLADRKGDDRTAMEHSLTALEFFRATGHRSGEAMALSNVGWSLTQLGEYPRALTSCEQGLALHRELGDRRGLGGSWASLGLVRQKLSEYGQAVTCYRNALALFRQTDDRVNEADTLARLGGALAGAGDLPAARTAWRQALAILDELGHPDAEQVRYQLIHN